MDLYQIWGEDVSVTGASSNRNAKYGSYLTPCKIRGGMSDVSKRRSVVFVPDVSFIIYDIFLRFDSRNHNASNSPL